MSRPFGDRWARPRRLGRLEGKSCLGVRGCLQGALQVLLDVRRRLVETVGPDAAGHAAATVTAFSGLVRVADGTGIPIDDGLATASADIRESLALATFGGSANSDHVRVEAGAFSTVEALFDNSD